MMYQVQYVTLSANFKIHYYTIYPEGFNHAETSKQEEQQGNMKEIRNSI